MRPRPRQILGVAALLLLVAIDTYLLVRTSRQPEPAGPAVAGRLARTNPGPAALRPASPARMRPAPPQAAASPSQASQASQVAQAPPAAPAPQTAGTPAPGATYAPRPAPATATAAPQAVEVHPATSPAAASGQVLPAAAPAAVPGAPTAAGPAAATAPAPVPAVQAEAEPAPPAPRVRATRPRAASGTAAAAEPRPARERASRGERTLRRGVLLHPGPGVHPPVLVSIPWSPSTVVTRRQGAAGGRIEVAERHRTAPATVQLSVLVEEDGTVTRAKVVRSSTALNGADRAALEAAMRARFRPATRDGAAGRMWTRLTLDLEPAGRLATVQRARHPLLARIAGWFRSHK